MLKSWKTSKDKKNSQTAPIKWRKWWRSPKLTVSRNREVLLKLAPQQWMMVFKNYKEGMAMGSSNTNAGIVYFPRLIYIPRVRTRARAKAPAPRHVWRFLNVSTRRRTWAAITSPTTSTLIYGGVVSLRVFASEGGQKSAIWKCRVKKVGYFPTRPCFTQVIDIWAFVLPPLHGCRLLSSFTPFVLDVSSTTDDKNDFLWINFWSSWCCRFTTIAPITSPPSFPTNTTMIITTIVI